MFNVISYNMFFYIFFYQIVKDKYVNLKYVFSKFLSHNTVLYAASVNVKLSYFPRSLFYLSTFYFEGYVSSLSLLYFLSNLSLTVILVGDSFMVFLCFGSRGCTVDANVCVCKGWTPYPSLTNDLLFVFMLAVISA